ncbi:hypothetical protein IAD21_03641 [Abditibacteriota bacterium]|nr:hypothetical protein IAD21_03641 [Abditibacteriota bacterium]
MNWKHTIDSIETREDFADFLLALQKDFDGNPQEWENGTLDSYLWSLYRWVNDMDGYLVNHSINVTDLNPWQLLANILYAAKIYE